MRSYHPLGLFLIAAMILQGAIPAWALDKEELFAPIVISPKNASQEYAKKYLGWAERTLVAPFEKRTRQARWHSAALKFVREASEHQCTKPRKIPPDSLMELGARLSRVGCDDPLVDYLRAKLLLWDNSGKDEAHRILSPLAKRAAATPGTDVLRWLIWFEFAHQMHAKEWLDPLPALTAEVIKGGSFLPEEADIFYEHVSRIIGCDHYTKYEAQYVFLEEPSPLGEWFQLMASGDRALWRALNARGDDYASKVTPERWKDFELHMQKARSMLTRAWKLRPDWPQAATEMIEVVGSGGGGSEAGTTRLWLDRATAARCDYLPAYQVMFNYLRPQWGGSHREMLAFGMACAEARAHGFALEDMFFIATYDVAHAAWGPEWRTVYRDRPDVAQMLVTISRERAERATAANEWQSTQSYLAVNAYLAGDYELARQTYVILGGKIDPRAEKKLHNLAIRDFQQQMTFSGATGGNEYIRAGELYEARGFAAGAELLRAALPGIAKEWLPRVRIRLALCELTKEFETGQWILLPTPSVDDPAWFINPPPADAHIRAMAKRYPGTPDHPAPPRRAPLHCILPVGDRFEWRWILPAQAAAQLNEKAPLRFFVDSCETRLEKPLSGARRVTFQIQRSSGASIAQIVPLDFMDKPRGPEANVAWPAGDREIALRIQDGTATLAIDGKVIYDQLQLPGRTYNWPQTRIGFDRGLSDTVSAQKVEVRKLPPAREAIPAAPRLPSAMISRPRAPRI